MTRASSLDSMQRSSSSFYSRLVEKIKDQRGNHRGVESPMVAP